MSTYTISQMVKELLYFDVTKSFTTSITCTKCLSIDLKIQIDTLN